MANKNTKAKESASSKSKFGNARDMFRQMIVSRSQGVTTVPVRIQQQQKDTLRMLTDVTTRLKDNCHSLAEHGKIATKSNVFGKRAEQIAVLKLKERGIEEEREIKALERKVRLLNRKIKRAHYKSRGNLSNRDAYLESVAKQKEIARLENRIDKTLVRVNELGSHNRGLRLHISSQIREREVVDEVHELLETEFQKMQSKISNRMRRSHSLQQAASISSQALSNLEQQMNRYMLEFEHEWMETGAILQEKGRLLLLEDAEKEKKPPPEQYKFEEAEMQDPSVELDNESRVQRKTRPQSAHPSGPSSESRPHSRRPKSAMSKRKLGRGRRAKKAWMEETARPGQTGDTMEILRYEERRIGARIAHEVYTHKEYTKEIKRKQQRLRKEMQMFENIREATEIGDFTALVETFLEQELRNFDSYNTANKLHEEADLLQAQLSQIEKDIERLKKPLSDDIHVGEPIDENRRVRQEKEDITSQIIESTESITHKLQGLEAHHANLTDSFTQMTPILTEILCIGYQVESSETAKITLNDDILVLESGGVITDINADKYLALVEQSCYNLMECVKDRAKPKNAELWSIDFDDEIPFDPDVFESKDYDFSINLPSCNNISNQTISRSVDSDEEDGILEYSSKK